MSDQRICANFSDDLKEIALELYNRDDRAAQRRVHYLVNELPEDQRLKGLFRVGSKICMMRDILRADLERRARGEALPAVVDVAQQENAEVDMAIAAMPRARERASAPDICAGDEGAGDPSQTSVPVAATAKQENAPAVVHVAEQANAP